MTDNKITLPKITPTIINFGDNKPQLSKKEVKQILAYVMLPPTGIDLKPVWITAIRDFKTQREICSLSKNVQSSSSLKPTKSTVLFILSYKKDYENQPFAKNNKSLRYMYFTDLGTSMGYLEIACAKYGQGNHPFFVPPIYLNQKGHLDKYGIPSKYRPLAYLLVGPKALDTVSSATAGKRSAQYNII